MGAQELDGRHPRRRSLNGDQEWSPYKSGGVHLISPVNTTTRGILLRKRKLSDTSLIVSWCTDSLGIIQTVARGARRPRSPFRGQLDLFFEAELSIAKSRRSNLHTLREVVVVNAFAGIRTDHRRTHAASYFVELIEVCTEIEHQEPESFICSNAPSVTSISMIPTSARFFTLKQNSRASLGCRAENRTRPWRWPISLAGCHRRGRRC